jgi:hypothetical protein
MAAQIGKIPYHADTFSAPAFDGFTVIPSDTNNLQAMARALYVGVTGNVTILTSMGTQLTLVGVQAGQILPILATRVLSTGTTATGIVALI